MRRLFELSRDMLGTATAEGYFTRLNPAWESTLGWSIAELMAVPFLSFVHLDDVDATETALANPDRPTEFAFENRFRTRDGDYRLLEWTGGGEGGVAYFVARDVTERRATEIEHGEAATARRDAEAEARRSADLHRILTANLPDTTVFLLDRDLRILVADGEAIRRLPWFDEKLFQGRLVAELDGMVPADVLKLSLTTYRAALQGKRGSFEFLSEGLTFSIQAVPVRGEDEAVESVLVVARDVTQRTEAQQRIAHHARQQKAVAELGRFALESHDLAAVLTAAVERATSTLDVDGGCIVELSEDGLSQTVVAGVGLPEGVDAVSSASVPIQAHGRPFGVLDVRAREPRGFSEDDVTFLSAIATLVTVAVERHSEEQATRHAALHDPLTNLANRTLALDRIAHALNRRHRECIDVAVLVLDLDRFKLVNDAAGHAAGDDVLRALAGRLSGTVSATDTVARLSGDEFIVICPDVDGVRGATELADRLTAAVTRPLALDSGDHAFKVSVGIALAADRGDTPESLLRDADTAMYRAKARGRGRCELFDEAVRTEALERALTEADLRRAIERGELEVWYQLVVDLATGRPVSTEALARWEHPERGMIPPTEFIPIAEETGLIADLGAQILEQACVQTAAWQRQFDPALTVSVNVSGRQAVDPAFPAQVAAIAERSGLRPGTLTLEITESVLMEEADSPITVLSSLQDHGVKLVLDDFGTGYSSLSRLKGFPLDALKIDRSFISGVDSHDDDRAIVKATIDMAHALSLTVVAEGVETLEQEAQLRAFGCDLCQGYLYARPQPMEAVTDLLAAGRPADRV